MAATPSANHHFRAGDRVRVKSREAILSTLDERGELDGMPFMPEMLRYCGEDFKVYKRADKTCDTAQFTGLREMKSTVHLDDLRCDGSAHGGCQHRCLLFWREEWLESDPADASAIMSVEERSEGAGRHDASDHGATVETLERATTVDDGTEDGSVRYSCQATQLRAASRPLSVLDVRQYVRDVTSGNTSTRRVVTGLLISLFNKYQDFSRRVLPPHLRIRAGLRYPFIQGGLDKTPREDLGLQPGDLVQIKSLDEIVATLNKNNLNRGMSFDVEMIKYCGTYARVKSRVEQIIDDTSGEMVHMKNPCLILENVICDADFHRFCPRSIYPFWREIWLKKVPEGRAAVDSAHV